MRAFAISSSSGLPSRVLGTSAFGGSSVCSLATVPGWNPSPEGLFPTEAARQNSRVASGVVLRGPPAQAEGWMLLQAIEGRKGWSPVSLRAF